jgi:hypothetical protein
VSLFGITNTGETVRNQAVERSIKKMCDAFGIIVDKLNPAYCIDVPREQFTAYRFRLYLATVSTAVREIRSLHCPLTTDDLWKQGYCDRGRRWSWQLATLKYHDVCLLIRCSVRTAAPPGFWLPLLILLSWSWNWSWSQYVLVSSPLWGALSDERSGLSLVSHCQ